MKYLRIGTLTAALATSVFFFVAGIGAAWAACPASQLFNPLDPNCSGAGPTSVAALGWSIANFILAIAGSICGIMVAVGGFQMMTAAGNPEKFAAGKKTVLYAAIGLIVILFATSVVPLLKDVLAS